MPFDDLRAMIDTFDSDRVDAWRTLSLGEVLAECALDKRTEALFRNSFGTSASRSVGAWLDARSLSSFGPAILERLEPVLIEHLDRFLDGTTPTRRDDPLHARLRELGLAARLDDSPGVLSFLVARTAAHQGLSTVGVLSKLTGARGKLAEARAEARQYLETCADRAVGNERVQREQLTALAMPAAEPLRALDARLAALAPRKPKPRPAGTFAIGRARFVEPGALVYAEDGHDRITIDLFAETPSITTADDELVPFAVNAARCALRYPCPDLLAFATAPRWSRTLSMLGSIGAAPALTRPIGFRVDLAQRAVRAGILDNKTGSLQVRTAPQLASVTASPVDARAIRALGGHFEDQLTALVDHPRVWVGDRPARVVRAAPVLRACEVDAGVTL